MAHKRKSRAVVDTDEANMNLTPMIDMTFLLVVFFMLTIDLTTKEFVPVDLPHAYYGIEDKEDPTDDTPRFVINLESNGDVTFKGNSWSLSSADPMAQEVALRALRQELMVLTQDPKYSEPDSSSMIPVLIHGDRAAKWQYVQWIMQVCVDQKIKIYKIQFAVKQPPKEDEE